MSKAQGKSREEIIQALSERIDKFEKYATPHSRLMADLASLLAKRFGLSPLEVSAIAEAARLHDIGLYAMSPVYHDSPDALRLEDRLDLWRHSIIGEQEMAKREFSRHAQLLVRWHHEWWNGTGYPDMLAFEDIPIGARILRAVELYSALTSARPYRAALGPKETLDTLTAAAGFECDPYVIRALIALLEERYPAVETPENSYGDFLVVKENQTSEAPGDRVMSYDQIKEGVEAERNEVRMSRDADDSPTGEAAGPSLWSPSLSPSDEAAADEADTAAMTPTATGSFFPRETSEAQPAGQETSPASERLEPILKRRLPLSPLATTPLTPEPVAVDESPTWLGWTGSGDNKKSLLAFEASVLRQIPFETIAIARAGDAKLDWYLKVWGKRILTNDTRNWAVATARAVIESREPISERLLNQLLQDIYVPGNRLTNPSLRRWFSETDAWWMENLRRNIAGIEDEGLRSQALLLGIQTGDYALSFNDETVDLRRPLATIFWRLAGRFSTGNIAHPYNRVFSLPPHEFIQQARADLLYLNLPATRDEKTGAQARSEWRECWVTGGAEAETATWLQTTLPQTRQAYLTEVDRQLRAAAHIRKWAIGCQEVGLTSARDIAELVKQHRPVRATYSKDVTEVAGGLRSYIIVAEK